MSPTGDYSPIVQTGTLKRKRGIRDRALWRASLTSVSPEICRVFMDGRTVIAGDRLSAGEKYWSPDLTWVDVDVGDHELAFVFEVDDPEVRAGYSVQISATVAVVKPDEVVRRNARSVSAVVSPRLHEAIQVALSARRRAEGLTDTVASLNGDRSLTETAVRAALKKDVSLDWLSVAIASVAVAFDAETATHVRALIESERKGQLDQATRANLEQAQDFEIRFRTKWSEYLEPRLRNPATRAVEIVAANPSEDNIRSVVNELNATDQQFRSEFLTALRMLLDEHLVGDLRDIEAIQVLVEGLQAGMRASSSRQVSTGFPQGEIGTKTGTPDEERAEDTDRSWGGQ